MEEDLANYRAIGAVSQAIIRLLKDSSAGTEFDGVDFALVQAADFEKPQTDSVTLYLYRVEVGGSRRNFPPRLLPDGKRTLPPLAVDLHYLLTPWAADPVKQQELLGWCMRKLADYPILPPGLLNLPPETGTFWPDETVELIADALSLQDMDNLWDAVKPAQLSVGYLVRMLLLESAEPSLEGRAVQTREFQVAKVVS